MHAQAQLDAAVATEQERREGRVRDHGPMKGTFWVSGPHVSHTTPDFGPGYVAALQALLDQDERVRAGHAFAITIC